MLQYTKHSKILVFYFIFYLERNKNVFVIHIDCIKRLIHKTGKWLLQSLKILFLIINDKISPYHFRKK